MDNELFSKLMRYVEHDDNCMVVRMWASAGRPTKDGGYEQKIQGKWYQVKPVDKSPKFKCDCGLDDILKDIKRK